MNGDVERESSDTIKPKLGSPGTLQMANRRAAVSKREDSMALGNVHGLSTHEESNRRSLQSCISARAWYGLGCSIGTERTLDADTTFVSQALLVTLMLSILCSFFTSIQMCAQNET